MIIVGGMSIDTNPKDHMMSYDLETDRWQSLPSMPTARYASFSFLIHDKLYVLGRYCFDGRLYLVFLYPCSLVQA